MCGVAALLLADASKRACGQLIDASYLLQHRGQDACGIVTSDHHTNSYLHRATGLVTNVFATPQSAEKLKGHMGMAHLRYPTTNSYGATEAQPITSKAVPGIYIAHNGNLLNAPEVRTQLHLEGYPAITTNSDSEVLLNSFISNFQKFNCRSSDLHTLHTLHTLRQTVCLALREVYRSCLGSFACVAMISGSAIIGFRDANGIKPLVYGKRENMDGSIDYMIASESVVLDNLGFSDIIDIKAGEAVFIPTSSVDRSCIPSDHQIVPAASQSPDIFEYVYFARSESIIDGISVHRSRQAMGIALAETILAQLSPPELAKLDVVIPVPETSNTCAIAAARHLKKPLSLGLARNRYVHRTFIMPGESQRKKAVSQKLNAIKEEFAGRNVLLIDDSIVRGTTSKEVIRMARSAGAKKVYFASCSPPIRYPHIYGIDLSQPQQLIAFSKTESAVKRYLECDGLFYLPLPQLVLACLSTARYPYVTSFEIGMFSGNYVTGGSQRYIKRLAFNNTP